MKKVFMFIWISVFMLFNAVSSYAGGCWSLDEITDFEFMELDGKLVLSFKDAVTCEPIKGAEVILGKSIKRITDSKGRIFLSMKAFTKLMDATIPIVCKKRGYIPLKATIRVMAGSVWDKRFLMTKYIPANSARFVLSWGKNPRDLDLHLVSSDFHISYRNMRSSTGKAKLDRDARYGYGPETITLEKIEPGKIYTLYVHNYSNEEGFSGRERIYVYINKRLDRVIELPNTRKRAIKVLEIKNQDVKYLNIPCEKVVE